MSCGYDLTGLELGSRCPECNTPIEDSAMMGEQHRASRALVLWCLAAVVGIQCGLIALLVAWRLLDLDWLSEIAAPLFYCASWAAAYAAVMFADDEENEPVRYQLKFIAAAALVLPIVVGVTFWLV